MRRLSFLAVVLFSAALSGCTGDDGGGTDAGVTTDAGPDACTGPTGANPCPTTQFCDTDGVCKDLCDDNTDCSSGQACDPDTQRCIPSCANDGGTTCSTTQVCGPDGICEDPCEDQGCLSLQQLCVPEENACGDPTTATSCTFATTNGVPTRDANGPLLYGAEAADGTSSDDTTNCPGGGFAVFVSARYSDPTGDAETADLCVFTPDSSGSAFIQYNTNATGGVRGCANQEDLDSGSNASMGRFTIPLCFESSRPANFVMQVRDAAGNDSNPVCLDLPPN